MYYTFNWNGIERSVAYTNQPQVAQGLTALYLPEVPYYSVDTETTGLDPHSDRLCLVQIGLPRTGDRKRPDCLLFHIPSMGKNLEWLKHWLTASKKVKIAHNWAFDYKMLYGLGIQAQLPIFDTMLASQLVKNGLNTPRGYHSLAKLYERECGTLMDKEEQLSDWLKSDLSVEQIRYAAIDAIATLELYPILRQQVIDSGQVKIAQIEFSSVRGTAQMEYNGMRLDTQVWDRLVSEWESERKVNQDNLNRLMEGTSPIGLADRKSVDNINVNAHGDLKSRLHRLGIPLEDTKYSTLASYAGESEACKAILDVRTYEKRLSTYAPIPDRIHPNTGRLHGSFRQLGARSGRMSSTNPNMQNLPRSGDVRSAFIPDPGNVYAMCDFSGQELRLIAEVSGDRGMVKALNQGIDLHRKTASMILGLGLDQIDKATRQIFKAVNFGLGYMQQPEGFQVFAISYGVHLTIDKAVEYFEGYLNAYPGIRLWHRRLKNDFFDCKRSKTPIESRTLLGRRRLDVQKATIMANHPVQGSGADMIKIAQGNLVDSELVRSGKAKLIAIVHDEIIMETAQEYGEEARELLANTMQSAGEQILTKVPCEAEANIGTSWAEK